MFKLVKNTHWTEDFILWKLPLARAVQYLEAIALYEDKTVMPKDLSSVFDNVVKDKDY